MSNKNPQIEWSEISGKECLRFTFGENFTADEAMIAIEDWKNCFKGKSDKPIILIWDCRKMRRYELGAKEQWTNALNEMKAEIDKIWLISDSIIVSLGALIMGHVSKIKIHSVNSESKIIF